MKKNKSFFKKNKIYLIIGTLLVVWICFVVFIIFPSMDMLRNDYDSVQMKLIDVKNNDDKLNKLGALKDSYEKVENGRKNLETIFHSNEIVSLARELEVIAQKTDNNIVISVDEGNKKIQELSKSKSDVSKENALLELLPAKNYFTIKISLVGDYNGLIKFVNKLNNMKYYNNIVSFKIESKTIPIEKNTSNENNNANNGINILGSGGDAIVLNEEEKEKLVLNSDLDVIFYSLEKNDGKK